MDKKALLDKAESRTELFLEYLKALREKKSQKQAKSPMNHNKVK